MKITTDTPELLIVDHQPLLWPLLSGVIVLGGVGIGFLAAGDGEPWIGLAFGVAGLIAGGVSFWITARRVQLVLNRAEGWAEIRRRWIGGQSALRFGLADVARATVQTTSQRGSVSRAKSRRIVIAVADGESVGDHPLEKSFSNVGPHYAVADRINAWLEPS